MKKREIRKYKKLIKKFKANNRYLVGEKTNKLKFKETKVSIHELEKLKREKDESLL